MRDFVVLEMDSDAATGQVIPGRDKILAAGPQCEMENRVRPRRRRRICAIGSCGKQGNGCLAPRYEDGHAAPHSGKTALESKDIDVPVGRAFNVPNGECNVIESLNFKHANESRRSWVLEKAKCRGVRGMSQAGDSRPARD